MSGENATLRAQWGYLARISLSSRSRTNLATGWVAFLKATQEQGTKNFVLLRWPGYGLHDSQMALQYYRLSTDERSTPRTDDHTVWDYEYKHVRTATKATQQETGLERLCIESNLHVNHRTTIIA